MLAGVRPAAVCVCSSFDAAEPPQLRRCAGHAVLGDTETGWCFDRSICELLKQSQSVISSQKVAAFSAGRKTHPRGQCGLFLGFAFCSFDIAAFDGWRSDRNLEQVKIMH